MKTYLKTLWRIFKKQFTRLISIISMVLISVGFIAGIGGAVDKINFSMSDLYRSANVSDFIVKDEEGISDALLSWARERYGEENVGVGAYVDVTLTVNGEEQLVRLAFLSGSETVNVPERLKSLEETAEGDVCAAEEKDNKIAGVPLGTVVEFDFVDVLKQLAKQNGKEDPRLNLLPPQKRTVRVTSTVRSPLTFALDGEPSYLNPEDTEIPDNIVDVNKLITVDNILYLDYGLVPAMMGKKLLPLTDLMLSMPGREKTVLFNAAYERQLSAERKILDEQLGESAHVLTLKDNYSFHSLYAYGKKVMGICIVLMVAFLLVTALVVLSTMTRLIEEERAQIACLQTLGYPAWRIIFKYLLFAAIGCAIGGVGAFFVNLGVVRLLYTAFYFSFSMPPISAKSTFAFFYWVLSSVVLATLLATALAGKKMTDKKPAVLLRPKVPKAGKKVFLERIPFLWNLFSFKYKSTMRNVLRYVYRFLMTVFAVAVSTALITAGLGLLDLCLFQGFDSPTVMSVAIVVIFFAGLLTAVVIYTLTNINISERTRELATLMVLGYHDSEVAGYIYREIYIDTFIGILLGYPTSALLVYFVFTVIGMGALGSISWFMWLLAPVVVLLFTAFVTLLLRRKIVKIRMNESLKAIE